MLEDLLSGNRVVLSREEAEKELRDFLLTHDNIRVRLGGLGLSFTGEEVIVTPNLLKEEKP